VQPTAALSLALRQAGFVVKLLTNVNHVEFLRSLDLDAEGVNTDTEASLRDDPLIRELMANGAPSDPKRFGEKMIELNKKTFPEVLARKIKETQDYRPDVILAAALDSFDASAIACVQGVPMICVPLQLGYPSRDFQTTLMRKGRCFPHLTIGTILSHGWWSMEYQSKKPELVKQLPASEEFLPANEREWMLAVFHPMTPIVVGFSPSLYSVARDWSEDVKDRVNIAGFWTIPREAQETKLVSGDPSFGGDDRARLEAFLAQDDTPVYVGWGSMVAVSAEYMTCLAVRALKQAGLRGIVLGGVAGLEVSLLDGQVDAEALAAYAEKRVLFVRTAPHEWLFPQCAAITHHGGAGTTAAAIRSGMPSVVTPCAFDQFDNARLVAVKGGGIELKHISKVKAEELAKALKRCTSDKQLINSSRKLGERLRAEDGLGAAVRAVDDFIVEELDTGAWQARFDDRREELRELRAQPKRCCSGARWLGRMWCSGRPNEYALHTQSRKLPT